MFIQGMKQSRHDGYALSEDDVTRNLQTLNEPNQQGLGASFAPKSLLDKRSVSGSLVSPHVAVDPV